MKKRDLMKNLISLHILCLLFFIACANNTNQIPKSLSSSYDGIWDGYAQTPYERQYIKMEIKNGIVSGFFEFDGWYKDFEVATSGEKKINGYITSDNNLIFKPIPIRHPLWRSYPALFLEANVLSPDRIEGTYSVTAVDQQKVDQDAKWYVVKPATGKSDSTISNVERD
jgi:hypothetical protein